MRVCLLNPPFLPEHGRFSRAQRSPAITRGGTLYYPIWLCYAAGVLEEDGLEVRIIDAPATGMDRAAVREEVRRFAPRLLVVDTSTPSIDSDLVVADELRELTGACTVLVGTHVSALPEASLRACRAVDAVARREYEHSLRELARQLRDGATGVEALRGVEGLSYREGEAVIHNPDRPPLEDLDGIPFVSRVYKRHLELRRYFYTIAQHPQVAIFSSRGCPHRCCFCVYPQVMHGHRLRARSVENLVEEFAFVERELPEVREIFVEDDSFTLDRRRVLAFSAAYRARGLRISWIANSRADVDRETLEALRACRCRLLCVGFESGDQAVLDGMGKRLRLERARRFVAEARRAGILVHGCFVVGVPGETRETMEATLRFARAVAPDTAQFYPLMVYPGTEAYAWAQREGHLTTEDFRRWLTPGGQHGCVVSRPGLTDADLVSFCNRARREFYLRPAYLMYRLRRLLRYPREDGPRMWKSLRVFGRHLLRGP